MELACFRLRAPTGSKWRLRDDSLRALALRCTAPELAWSWLTTCPRGTGRCRIIGAPCGVCTALGTPRASGRGFSLFGVRGAGGFFFRFFASHLARAYDGLRCCAARLGTVCSSAFVGRCALPYATLSRFQQVRTWQRGHVRSKKGDQKRAVRWRAFAACRLCRAPLQGVRLRVGWPLRPPAGHGHRAPARQQDREGGKREVVGSRQKRMVL